MSDSFFIFYKKIKKEIDNLIGEKMQILKIQSRISFETLLWVLEKDGNILIPVVSQQNGYEHESYVCIAIEEVKPLGKEGGDSFFKGQTVHKNGIPSVKVDGATFMMSPHQSSHYGYLAIYD